MQTQANMKRSLEAWIEALPSHGRYSFTRSEAMRELGLRRKAFNRVAGRLSAANRIARIHGEFYVVVPLEQAAAGVVPADWFIVELMKHQGCPFYVGLLSAAQYYGAAHQRPQSYQVITSQPIRPIECRGVAVRFFVKRDPARTPAQQIKGVTGYIPVSTPEATATDLIVYARQVGGLDRVLTVLQELAERIDARRLVRAVEANGQLVAAQRLGWLIERTDYAKKAKPLARWLTERKPLPAKLEPSRPIRGSHRDPRWQLWINSELESDLA
jgi:predicted transcriptional regulator of viral defense system